MTLNSVGDYRPGQKKKISKLTLGVYADIIILALYLSAALGTAFDLSVGADGEIDNTLIADSFMTAVSAPNVIFSALSADGYAKKILFIAAVAIGIYVLYKYSMLKKRLHRKGVEHGSAVWGDEAEMRSLKDSEFIGKDKKSGMPKYGKPTEPKFKPLLKSDGTRVFDKSGEFVGVMVDNNIILTKQVYMSLNSR